MEEESIVYLLIWLLVDKETAEKIYVISFLASHQLSSETQHTGETHKDRMNSTTFG